MHTVTLKVADKRPEGVDDKQYKIAKKKGEITVNAITAREAVKLGKGLYEVKPEPKPEVEIKGLPSVDEMDKAALVAEMTMYGKPPQKQMTMEKAKAFVLQLREKAAEMIVDVDPEE